MLSLFVASILSLFQSADPCENFSTNKVRLMYFFRVYQDAWTFSERSIAEFIITYQFNYVYQIILVYMISEKSLTEKEMCIPLSHYCAIVKHFPSAQPYTLKSLS
jgi:hypothetical protein